MAAAGAGCPCRQRRRCIQGIRRTRPHGFVRPGCRPVRLHLLDDAGQVAGVAQVAVVQLEVGVVNVRVLVDVVNAVGVEAGGTAFDAVHDVAFFQQKLSQVGAILASDTSDQGDFGVVADVVMVCAGFRCYWIGSFCACLISARGYFYGVRFRRSQRQAAGQINFSVQPRLFKGMSIVIA